MTAAYDGYLNAFRVKIGKAGERMKQNAMQKAFTLRLFFNNSQTIPAPMQIQATIPKATIDGDDFIGMSFTRQDILATTPILNNKTKKISQILLVRTLPEM